MIARGGRVSGFVWSDRHTPDNMLMAHAHISSPPQPLNRFHMRGVCYGKIVQWPVDFAGMRDEDGVPIGSADVAEMEEQLHLKTAQQDLRDQSGIVGSCGAALPRGFRRWVAQTAWLGEQPW